MKLHFGANIAENINNVKMYVVRAEAAFMIDDIDSMRKNYATVQQENGALVAEYARR
jgi:hypothetical protein